MPYKRKASAVYWVSYVDPGGKRVRRSTGTTDRKEALALEAKWRLEAFRAQRWDVQPERSFEELAAGYLKEMQGRKRSWGRDRYSVKQLRRGFAGMTLRAIGAAEIAAYKRMRRDDAVTDSTIAKELRLLSAAFNHARTQWGWDVANPVAGRVPKEPPGRVRWITERDAQTLIAAARSDKAPWLADFIELGLHTGMRSGEMLGLTWDRVDLGHRLVYLTPDDQKNRTHGSVPVNDIASQVLQRRFAFRQADCPDSAFVFCNRQGKRIASVKHSFATACKRAGIANFTPHDLRHTCAAWLVQRDVPIRTVCALLRHKDIGTTMRYAHLAPDNVRDAAAALETVTKKSQFGHSDNGMERKTGVSY